MTVPSGEWGAGLPTGPPRAPKRLMVVAWIVWCSAWAVFWITVGWFILPGINVVLCLVSCVLATIFARRR